MKKYILLTLAIIFIGFSFPQSAAGLTFGYTGAGTTQSSFLNMVRGVDGTPASNGSVDSVSIYQLVETNAHLTRGAIYDKTSSGILTNGVTEEIDVPVQAKTLTTFNFVGTKPTVIANDEYWIVASCENETGACAFFYDSQAGKSIIYDATTYVNAFPATIDTGDISADYAASIYATYQATAAPYINRSQILEED